MEKEILVKKSILEGNISIADFEQRKFYGKHTIDKYGGETHNALPEMKYHESWDWLMPVVERIERDISKKPFYGFTVEIRDHYCCIVCHEKGRQDGVVCSTPYLTKPESKILAVWNMVVEFIKWYNSFPA